MNWYNLSITEVIDKLGLIDSQQGLSSQEITSRLLQYGANEIPVKKRHWLIRLAGQFTDPMVIILMITGLVTAVLTFFGQHMLPDTIVIWAVVILNAVLGFIQEGKAEGALDALKNMMVPEALVIRNGEQQRIPAPDLVPGDIVVLEGGDKLPADVRFLAVNNCYIDESSLTGESVAVQKHTAPITGDNLVPGDCKNMGFSGTYLTQGTAKAIVVETGMNTAFGKIANMVQSAGSSMTPMQVQMKEFIHTLIIAILVVGGALFIYELYLGYDTAYSFLGAISLVVATIPEMLPALITSILAMSGTIMARKKALVRKLPAAETFGAVSVICSDKTGTLTENHMTVTRVYAGNEVFQVSGTGDNIKGEFLKDNAPITTKSESLNKLLLTGYHCNNAHVGESHSSGDPTEVALKISGAKFGIIANGVHRLEEIPFDSRTKYMAVLVEDKGEHYIYVKGAPEVVLDMCTTSIDSEKEQVLKTAESFAKDALRTLGFAYKKIAKQDLNHADLCDMTFAGLQGMIDPPKVSAIEAIEKCKGAGIRTVMITGDHPHTAQAVAYQLGIDAKKVITGKELADISEEKLRQVVKEVSVFARVAPEHKKAIAEAHKANGEVVAMTGDGVNDAPALKAADIGAAMGITGTEVAKEASDVVLVDDNFATIVTAVEEGRHTWNNLQKAILYTIPTNAAQALLIIGAVLIAAFVPLFATRFVLEPVQILWINLLDSVLLTMPLMMEAKEKGILNIPPRNVKEKIINKLFLSRVIIIGLAIATPGFIIYYYFGHPAVVNGEIINELLLTQAQTAAFWAILLAHFGYVISARSIHASAFTLNPFGNKWLLAGIAGSILIRFIPTFIPPAASLFKTAEFPIEWWWLIALCFFPSFLAIEGLKLWEKQTTSIKRKNKEL